LELVREEKLLLNYGYSGREDERFYLSNAGPYRVSSRPDCILRVVVIGRKRFPTVLSHAEFFNEHLTEQPGSEIFLER